MIAVAEQIEAGPWDVSRADYHADRSALSNSALRDFRRSVPLFHGRHVTGTIPPLESTASMALGTALHSLVLEPDTFHESVAVAPDIDRRTKAGKAAWESFTEASGGLTIITDEQVSLCSKMAGAIFSHEEAAYLLSLPGPVEHAIRWQDQSGLWVRNLVDKWLPSKRIVIDLKTSKDPTPNEFAKSAANFDYHCQAALYSKGIEAVYPGEPVRFLFIVVGSEPPHEVCLYFLDQDAITLGHVSNQDALDEIAKRRATGNWASRHSLAQTLSLPRWKFMQQ